MPGKNVIFTENPSGSCSATPASPATLGDRVTEGSQGGQAQGRKRCAHQEAALYGTQGDSEAEHNQAE